MTRWEQALQSVTEACGKVKLIASEALKVGEYRDVQRLIALAQRLELLAKLDEVAQNSTGKTESHGRLGGRPARKVKSGNGGRRKKGQTAVDDRGASLGARPTFFRGENELIKVGHSKKGAGSYEHRSPLPVLQAVTRALIAVGHPEKLVTVEQVLPIVKQVDGSDVPAYQTYLCIAWLRELGLVAQHGRRGYTVTNPGELDTLVLSRFRELPKLAGSHR